MNFSYRKVLVTGGTGFIGSHLVEQLLNKKADITVVSTSNPTNSKQLTYISPYNIKGDFDFVFHLATGFLREKQNLETYYKEIDISKGIFPVDMNVSFDKLIFTSAHVVYGIPLFLPITEKHPLLPVLYYGLAKSSLESYFSWLSEKHNFLLTIVRLSTIYGPRQTSKGFIPNLITGLLSNETVFVNEKISRDYLYVGDAVSALVNCANKKGVFNVGSGSSILLTEIADITRNICKKGKIKKFEKSEPVLSNQLDITKAKKSFGFEPSINLEEGLKRTIEWKKQQSS